MIADCAPETMLADDAASWAAMTDTVESALWRDPAARQAEWTGQLQFGLTDDTVDTVMQTLTATDAADRPIPLAVGMV